MKKQLDLSLSYKQLKFLNLMNYLISLKNFEMLKVYNIIMIIQKLIQLSLLIEYFPLKTLK